MPHMMNVLEQWIIIYPARALTGPRDGKADKEKENSIAKKKFAELIDFSSSSGSILFERKGTHDPRSSLLSLEVKEKICSPRS